MCVYLKLKALARPTWHYQNEDGGKSLKESLLYPSISNVVSLSQCFRVEINQSYPLDDWEVDVFAPLEN